MSPTRSSGIGSASPNENLATRHKEPIRLLCAMPRKRSKIRLSPSLSSFPATLLCSSLDVSLVMDKVRPPELFEPDFAEIRLQRAEDAASAMAAVDATAAASVLPGTPTSRGEESLCGEAELDGETYRVEDVVLLQSLWRGFLARREYLSLLYGQYVAEEEERRRVEQQRLAEGELVVGNERLATEIAEERARAKYRESIRIGAAERIQMAFRERQARKAGSWFGAEWAVLAIQRMFRRRKARKARLVEDEPDEDVRELYEQFRSEQDARLAVDRQRVQEGLRLVEAEHRHEAEEEAALRERLRQGLHASREQTRDAAAPLPASPTTINIGQQVVRARRVIDTYFQLDRPNNYPVPDPCTRPVLAQLEDGWLRKYVVMLQDLVEDHSNAVIEALKVRDSLQMEHETMTVTIPKLLLLLKDRESPMRRKKGGKRESGRKVTF